MKLEVSRNGDEMTDENLIAVCTGFDRDVYIATESNNLNSQNQGYKTSTGSGTVLKTIEITPLRLPL